MDDKKFVKIASSGSVTKTTWMGLTDVAWSKVAWLNEKDEDEFLMRGHLTRLGFLS